MKNWGSLLGVARLIVCDGRTNHYQKDTPFAKPQERATQKSKLDSALVPCVMSRLRRSVPAATFVGCVRFRSSFRLEQFRARGI
jgi:hypothetical protein